MVRLIACDLDDTLLNRQKTISPRTLRALNACRARGIVIMFSTARSGKDCARVSGLFAPDGFIACGGALAYIGKRVLYEAALSKHTANNLLRDLLPLARIVTAAGTDGTFYSNHPLQGDYAHYALTDFSEGLNGAYKITADIPSDDDALALAARHPDCDLFTFSGETWRRYAHPLAKKEKALQAVLDALAISPAEAAAFGDDCNDIGMLRLCGHGVAMGNAMPQVQAAARYVTADCDCDGVGVWLENHVLHGAEKETVI